MEPNHREELWSVSEIALAFRALKQRKEVHPCPSRQAMLITVAGKPIKVPQKVNSASCEMGLCSGVQTEQILAIIARAVSVKPYLAIS